MDARISHISLRSAALSVADLVLPRVCIVCGRTLLLSETHLCTACAADLPRTFFARQRDNPMAVAFNGLVERDLTGSQTPSGLRSLRSLRPLPAELGPSPCPCPGVDRPSGVCSLSTTYYQPYSYAAALFYYRGDSPYSLIPQALKYGRNFSAGRFFAQMLGRELAASELFADVDAIIPVPLHWMRRWRRGYNQAEVIATGITEELGEALSRKIPVLTKVLKRVRRTRTQTRLHHDGRYENVKSAFAADGRALAKALSFRTDNPLHLLLVDDVFTTGSTLLACERALRQILHNARISVATLSYVGR